MHASCDRPALGQKSTLATRPGRKHISENTKNRISKNMKSVGSVPIQFSAFYFPHRSPSDEHSQRQQLCKRTRLNMATSMPKKSNRKLDPVSVTCMSDSYPLVLKLT